MSTITTYTGKEFDPMSPDAEKIDIRDIAHALSLLCRGNGHVKHFFSVAQHCINCADEAKARGYSDFVILACLLHDASEAYMADVPSPLKSGMNEYKTAEDSLLDVIYKKFLGRLPDAEEKRLIKSVDSANLYYDLVNLLGHERKYPEPVMKSEFSNEFVPFETAEAQYLSLFAEYSSKISDIT